VRVTLVFSSQLPVAVSARWTCLSKRSLIPSVPVPNFTELTNWLDTFLHLTSSGVRPALHVTINFLFLIFAAAFHQMPVFEACD
jgi:hypothetical protein